MKADKDIKERVTFLAEKCRKYYKQYFTGQHTDITAHAYDNFFHELKSLVTTYEDTGLESSTLSLRAGFNPDEFVPHILPRPFTLNKVNNLEALDQFLRSVRKFSVEKPKFFCEYKLDGIGISLIYQKGELKGAITRGNGTEGADIFNAIKYIKNIPSRIPDNGNTTIVRGDIIIDRNNFFKFNAEWSATGLDAFGTANLCAQYILQSSIPSKDASWQTPSENLTFYAWEYISISALKSRAAQNTLLDQFGFSTIQNALLDDKEEILEFIDKTSRSRDYLPYDITGVVIRNDNDVINNEIGYSSHGPNWAIAWEFGNNRILTNITNIYWSPQRTGDLLPCAELVPVYIDGYSIDTISLGNSASVQDKELGIGSTIEVIRVGDTRPKLGEVIKAEGEVIIPTECPRCGSKLVTRGNQLCCDNGNCPGVLEAIIYFLLKCKSMETVTQSPRLISKLLVSQGVVKKFIDIFKPMSSSDMQELCDNITTHIRHLNLVELITSLGIPNIGYAMANRISFEVLNLRGLIRTLDNEEEMNSLSIGENIKTNLRQWYANPDHQAWLKELADLELDELSLKD